MGSPTPAIPSAMRCITSMRRRRDWKNRDVARSCTSGTGWRHCGAGQVESRADIDECLVEVALVLTKVARAGGVTCLLFVLRGPRTCGRAVGVSASPQE